MSEHLLVRVCACAREAAHDVYVCACVCEQLRLYFQYLDNRETCGGELMYGCLRILIGRPKAFIG